MNDLRQMNDFVFRSITAGDRNAVQSFDSSNASLDDFFKVNAYAKHINREASTTLVLANGELVAFFTLVDSQIDIEDSAEPCLNVARIAVGRELQCTGIGSSCLEFIKTLATMCNYRFLTLDSLHVRREFYKKRGFSPFLEEEYARGNEHGLVAMWLDLLDERLIEQYIFDEIG